MKNSRLKQLVDETERARKASMKILDGLVNELQATDIPKRELINELSRVVIILMGQGVATKLLNEEFLNEK